MPMVQIALAATGAGGVLGNALLGTGANQIVASALGGALLGGGTSAIAGQDAVKGALLGGAGGAASQYLSGVLAGLDTPVDFVGGTTEQINDALQANLVKDLRAAGVTNPAEFITNVGGNVSKFIPPDVISPTIDQPVVTPALEQTPFTGVTTNAPIENLQVTSASAPAPTVTQLINTIAAQQQAPAPIETVNVATPKAQVPSEAVNAVNALIQANVTKPIETLTVAAQPEKPQTVAEVIRAIATPAPVAPVVPEVVATGERPVTQEPVPSIPILSPVAPVVPVAPEVVVTGQAPIKEPEVSPTFPITMSPTAPTVVPQEPIKVEKEKEKKWTAGELADLARLGLLATTVFGMADGGSGSTQYDIVPVPEDWKSPVYQKDLPANTGAMTQLPAIDFGDRNLLIGTQWEKFLDPNYGQVPAPIQFSQPSNLSYQDLMGILGSKAGMPASSSLSINDVISGIQNQYGQIPSGSMGQKPT